MDRSEWAQVRRLFDAVCELSPSQWRDRLETLTHDQDMIEQALGLLQSQTRQLRKASDSIEMLLARVSVTTELGVGDRLDKWRLTSRIGGGGMGTVFLATRADEIYNQKVAIKLLHGLPSSSVVRQFAAERKILAGLQHPNIARLYDGGKTPEGQPYLVMEYVEGVRLDDHCMLGQAGLHARLRLFVKICRAVQAAHAKLVIHCDLKPSNVLVNADDEPALLDFGIARLLDGGGQDEGNGGFCTPGYASPELINGQAVDVGSDVFSLGVILTEMIACRPLHRRLEDASRPVPMPSAMAARDCRWQRTLRGDLDAIALKACALELPARYASVEALGDDVERYLASLPVLARGGSRVYVLRRFAQRRWRELGAVAAMVAISLGFAGWLFEANARVEQEAAVARQIGDFLVSSFDAADPRKRGLGEDREVTVRELLEASVSRMDTELADAPLQLARMQAVIGAAYQNMGLPQQAEAMLRRAAAGFLSPAVDDPVQASRVLSDLSTQLTRAARGQEALAVAQQALSLLEGRRHAEAEQSIALNSLGLAWAELERYDEAENAYRDALALRRTLDPGQAPGGIASIVHNMGLMYRSKGDLRQAETAFREAIRLKRLHKRSRYEYRNSLQALAITLAQQGRLREAAGMTERSLELAREIAGEQSTLVAGAYNELAGIYQDLGDYARSADYYLKAIDLSAELEGEGSMAYAVRLNNFATLEEARGDLESAESLYRRSLKVRRDVLGADSIEALHAEANLGRLLMRMGRLEASKPMIEHTLARLSERLAPSIPTRIRANLGLAEWHLRAGSIASAVKVLAQQRQYIDKAPNGVAMAYRRLMAEVAQRSGDADLAVRRWRSIVDSALHRDGPDSMLAAKSRIALAESLQMAGQAVAAYGQAESAAALLRSRLVSDSDYLVRLDRLVQGMAPVPAGSAGATPAAASHKGFD